MGRMLIAATVLTFVFATRATAGGVNLAWSDCLGGGGTTNRSFACNSNSGSHTMVASFAPHFSHTAVTGMTGIIDLCTGYYTLPEWWKFVNTGSCRQNALTVSFDFGTLGTCADFWQGTPNAITTYLTPFPDQYSARLLVDAVLPDGGTAAVEADVEYYGFKVVILNSGTVGSPSCAGCTVGACIVLNEIELHFEGGGSQRIQNPYTSNMLVWQDGVFDCPFVVPVENRSWGQIKALYR